ncbi:uncharacterized protein MONBRDRAFT_11532 [Monosiga brevicollis MX1]|uniref:Dynein heavy chain, cytoplasmic n=1 Tax=Monosiga brevicollis TaxID=81824 RepID=A9V9F2_MONBE|nr:uncharacterized protein MONBRDRAFT_11532 [Monosiga brevicollis MX1]EDQ85850.1 predicted protein [Monosiga brevicollis MX1]|eukprot:XP_001749329.1 hypothetical protein [Monosiga brevicollis MX1]
MSHWATGILDPELSLMSQLRVVTILPAVSASLSELQDDVEVPRIELQPHPIIMEVINKANAENRKPVVSDLGNKADDPTFLDELQRVIQRWVHDMQKITHLQRDCSTGSALQEVSFWLNLDQALQELHAQRESVMVGFTLEVLKHARRFHATVSFDSDIGLNKALETTSDYSSLMRGLNHPLSFLMRSTDLDAIYKAIFEIFANLRKLRKSQYPVARAVQFVQAISRDLSNRTRIILQSRDLLRMAYDDFMRVLDHCFKIFKRWDEEIEQIRTMFRDKLKSRRDSSLKTLRKVESHHEGLQQRIKDLSRFRQQHEQLLSVILRVLKPTAIQRAGAESDQEDRFALSEVNAAYDAITRFEPLDLSETGTHEWNAAMGDYQVRIEQVEKRIALRMRDQLGVARSANDMFRILGRFEVLFNRPSVREAVSDFRSRLLARVSEDIAKLKAIHEVRYINTNNFTMSLVRDIPAVSGRVIWSRQLDRQVEFYLKRLEQVFSHHWNASEDGRQLKQVADAFREELDADAIIQEWARETESRNMDPGRSALTIFKKEDQTFELRVDFPEAALNMIREVRVLRSLNYRLPLKLTSKMISRQGFSGLSSLLATNLKTYKRVIAVIEANPTIQPLLARQHEELHTQISGLLAVSWEHFKVEAAIKDFCSNVLIFQDKVNMALDIAEQLEKLVQSVATSEYRSNVLLKIIERMQHLIEELQKRGYVNLNDWLARLEDRLEQQLANVLATALREWCVALREYDHEALARGPRARRGSKAPRRIIAPILLEIAMYQEKLRIEPPPQHTRAALLRQLQKHVAVVTTLPRVRSTDDEVAVTAAMGVVAPSLGERTYCGLLTKLPNGNRDLADTYRTIDQTVMAVDEYMQVWLQYQALWDMSTEDIENELGDDIALWNELLVDLRNARRTFDTAETSKFIGPVEVDYGQVLTRVNMKYEALHREMLAKFGSKIGGRMNEFFSTIQRTRQTLEGMGIDGVSTGEAVSFITTLQDTRRRMHQWADDITSFQAGQKILERQRYAFPDGWLYTDSIASEWEAFNDLVSKKSLSLEAQRDTVQLKVVNEARQLVSRVNTLLQDWDVNKPVGGGVRPDAAVNALSIYESRFVKVKEEQDNLERAHFALDMDFRKDQRVDEKVEELNDLKASWSELSRIWTHINDLKQIPWSAVVPRKIRTALEDLINQLKNLPARVRSYASYETTMASVKGYLKGNQHIINLKSDALKERHWKQLIRALGVSWVLTDMTLGDVWDVDMGRNDKALKDIMLQAQGEMGLEEYLRQIREEWAVHEFDLVGYQNKTHLIRGWDDIFNLLKEHINSLEAMRMSPYFKVFEEESMSWHDKLSRLFALLDVWMDVQRQWVYLEGIFSGSADIKHLLPNESSRFQTISAEFLSLMKKVYNSRLAIEVLSIPEGQKSLERLADLLGKIQKALGEYLERERSAFPRFYFVGDEDLLEIIGNSKNVDRLQKHFKKMFAGVQTITLTNAHDNVLGVASKELERVPFATPVVCKDVKINQWLKGLEQAIRLALATNLAEATVAVQKLMAEGFEIESYKTWLNAYQAQLVVLAAQVAWSESVEAALEAGTSLDSVVEQVMQVLSGLADTVLQYQPPVLRKKLEHMITELVHQRDVVRELIGNNVAQATDFHWLQYMRFYFNPKQEDVMLQLSIRMADTQNHYGFEYLGLVDKLVQTPLTDRCFLTLTQALAMRQGGSPFGPAGTGKTESVKALGAQLGRFVLVFNCDETFDFQAMSRIFIGLCQVGAWGCFDEFNRLEERMLSAVSQQIQVIQLALKAAQPGQETRAELLGKSIPVSSDMAVFITMNPGYAGRSNLPDNLKKLFRPLAMTKPDRQLIAQVMLFSQGFRSAEPLSRKIVPLFILCAEQLSDQSHYDFGLRSLKAVLVSAGNIKRDRLKALRDAAEAAGRSVDDDLSAQIDEQEVLIQSVTQTLVPKLVADDIPLLESLLADVFPGVKPPELPLDELKAEIRQLCEERHYVLNDLFLTKMLQVYQVSCLQHGLMLVGPSGSGKSAAWRILLEALERVSEKTAARTGENKVPSEFHVIDPKAITKDELYGSLDPTTREWTDGLFTHTIRKIVDNQRGEQDKRQWVIFDGDVDPEWVENLNSVLDDNKLLTLPNGERLSLPPCIRIVFEVKDLRHATLATVSRCGMVWFSEDVLSVNMYFDRYLRQLRKEVLHSDSADQELTPDEMLTIQNLVADAIAPALAEGGLVEQAIHWARDLFHVMEYSTMRAVNSFLCMLNSIVRFVCQYNRRHDLPVTEAQVVIYARKRLIFSLLWALVGDSRGTVRNDFSAWLREHGADFVEMPGGAENVMDFDVKLPNGDWSPWQNQVPRIDIKGKVSGTDVVVPTLDTVRHTDVLYTWLSDHLPIVLCGPPGSGKTMTLFSALRALPHFDVAGLNFSSSTTPDLILKTFEQYCDYRRTPNGVTLAPSQLNKWLVVFMDECNLPAPDDYATVRVVTFVRQLVEQGGFWRTEDHTWVRLQRIQFVGACNPPTDPGRVPMDSRLLRHVPVVYVDYPGPESLRQIYGTFNRAMLDLQPHLKPHADSLTNAMVEFFTMTSQRFTADMQPHYIYSPREMTRWVKGIAEAIEPLDTIDLDGLVRLWAHEALRLFQDRLVYADERQWTDENIDAVARKHFGPGGADMTAALQRPILYSNWLSRLYMPVEQERLREHVRARLKVYCEEELDVKLVLFDEVLDHVLRIDRVFRQNQGHILMIGMSGAGKTTLSRFVAWMNGLTVFQVKVHNQYGADEFDEDLRNVLRRAGTKGEKIVFIMDEGNVQDTAFLERMNTLLANGEVPGLFEGDDYAALMNQCKEGAQRQGLVLEGNEELYRWFSRQVMDNLHVVFTMNPAEGGLQDRAATSPALFNRCVLNWYGDWSDEARFQVGLEFTDVLDLDRPDYAAPANFPVAVPSRVTQYPDHRTAVVNATAYVHQAASAAARRLMKREGRSTVITPRHFLEFVNQMLAIYTMKRRELEEQQLHLNRGLEKIQATFEAVEEEQQKMAVEEAKLREMNARANEKMVEVMSSKEETQTKQREAESLERELVQKQKEVAERKSEVATELAGVEPAVLAAKEAVEGIPPSALRELKALGNPPATVKMALEAALCMLNEFTTDWKAIRSVVSRPDFLPRIKDFDPDSVDGSIRAQMEKYVSNPDFNEERANKASKAAGPLVKWATAMLSYTTMLAKIEPLRNQLKKLARDADEMAAKHAAVMALLQELQGRLAGLTSEYNELQKNIGKTEDQLNTTRLKVQRSVQLLESLKDERERWSLGTAEFSAQLSTMVGDALLAGAFIGYAGYFDQTYRQTLMRTWRRQLDRSGIVFKRELSITEYLSTPDERLEWKANGLPDDDLCVENAIMLKYTHRFALVIDPAGQALDFVRKSGGDTNSTQTSFLDRSFRKTLETSLRFGTRLLVQDAETYDPLLNPVLNKEVKRSGGRVLLQLGQDDGIDLSPSFAMVLLTRNNAHQFPPDLCSRVTMVNFTITRGSLQSQCLNQALRCERPDIDERRMKQLKLQGAFRAQLRSLEKQLLQTLNEVGTSILDDDKVLTALETLKTQAAEVAEEVAKSDTEMQVIASVTKEYVPLAAKCSHIYFTLEQLHVVHFLYHYALQFFLDIFSVVLTQNAHLDGVDDSHQRLDIIVKDLFVETFRRVSPGLLHEHGMPFALTLAFFYVQDSPRAIADAEFHHFLTGGKGGSVAAFAGLADVVRAHCDAFAAWVISSQPESHLPEALEEVITSDEPSPVAAAMRRLLLLQATRPDRVLAYSHQLVNLVFGAEFMSQPDADLLEQAVLKEVEALTPVMLCGARGFDASGNVRQLAEGHNRKLLEVAIGSEEGFVDADRAIQDAAKTGKWVMLKNVHLGPSWLVTLEKKVSGAAPNPNFRIFLTTEINPKLPVNLLRSARVFVYEPASGLKASLLRTLQSVAPADMAREPVERSRVHLLLAWLHAVVVERLRYAPLCWSQRYEFGDSDFQTAMKTVDCWIDLLAQGRSHVDPAKIPWEAMRKLMSSSIYGGRIDNDTDQRLLMSFISQVFRPESGTEAILTPEGFHREQFLAWAASLPDSQSPSWLGLPSNAEIVLLTNRAAAMAGNCQMLQTTDDGDDEEEEVIESAASSAAPAWMKTVQHNCEQWQQALPLDLKMLERTPEKIKDPLFRFFDRETGIGSKLLHAVHADLADVIAACKGEIKQTNHIRSLMVDSFNKGLVPASWRKYKVPKDLAVSAWVVDFAERVAQLESIAGVANTGGDLQSLTVWIGGLFVPEAFITATRQAVAQAHGWALEKLNLSLDVREGLEDKPARSDQNFLLTNMRLDGARARGERLELVREPFTILPLTVLRWEYQEGEDEGSQSSGVRLPVYLNGTRAELIFTCDMQPPEGVGASTIYARGIALMCSSLSGVV